MNEKWLKAAGVRAIKTVSQTAIATIGTSAVIGDVNWLIFLGYKKFFLPHNSYISVRYRKRNVSFS